MGIAIFDTAGATTWTCPSGVNLVDVFCVGGGGGAGKTNPSGGGGGGGAFAGLIAFSVSPEGEYSLYVGGGGIATSDLPGEDSWFF